MAMPCRIMAVLVSALMGAKQASKLGRGGRQMGIDEGCPLLLVGMKMM